MVLAEEFASRTKVSRPSDVFGGLIGFGGEASRHKAV